MGFRFRKRISLGKLARINLSKSGMSVGVGPPGLNVNFSSRSQRTTIGIPGTGVYWQSTSKKPRYITSFGTSRANGHSAQKIEEQRICGRVLAVSGGPPGLLILSKTIVFILSNASRGMAVQQDAPCLAFFSHKAACAAAV